MKVSICMALFCLALGSGCRKDVECFSNIAANPNNWVYIAARELQVKEPIPDAAIRDQRLKLTDAAILTYDTLHQATNGATILAIPSDFRTALVTSAISRAELAKNRGKVLPVVVDRKFRIHFLTYSNGRWLSTNMLKTQVILLTSSLAQAPDGK